MAGGPGGPIVGRVRLRVAPDLSKFRKKVEKELAKLKDQEVGVTPDTGKLKKGVKKATKGMRAQVDVRPDTKQFNKSLDSMLYKARSKSVGMSAKLNLDRNGIRRQLNGIGRMIKSTGKGLGGAALTLDWQLGGNTARRKMTSWLDTVRNKTDAVGKSYKRIQDSVSPTTFNAEADAAAKRLNNEIRAIKDLSKANKAFNKNKNNTRYNPELHQEYQKLVDLGDKLRSTNPGQALKDFDKAADKIRRINEGFGLTVSRASKLDSDLNAARRTFDKMAKSSKDYNIKLRVTESDPGKTLIKTHKKLIKIQETAKRTSQSIKRSVGRNVRGLGNSIGAVYDPLKIASVSIRDNVKKLSGPAKRLGNSFRGVNKHVTGVDVGLRKASSSTKVFSSQARGIGSVFKRVPKIAQKSGTSSFKKFWSKFHQPENRIFGLTEMGWMATAITALIAPLSGLIGGALGALPALGLAAAAALGATVLGWEGIKDAAQAAAPAVNAAKAQLSATFRDRLTPQFAQLGGTLRKITPGLNDLAHGMSDFSQGFVNSLSSEKGVSNLNKVIGNTGKLFSDLKPFATDFTDGLLTMGAAGSETFGHLSKGLNSFGADFKQSMTEMSADGTLQEAITSTYDVIGSLGTNLGKIMRAGMEELPDIAESATGAFDSLGDGLVALMPLLSQFSQGVLDTLSGVFDGIGEMAPQLTDIFANIGPGLSDALSGIGNFAMDAFQPVLDFLEGLSPGMGDVLTLIGDGFTNLGEALANSNIGEFAGDLGSHLSDMLTDVTEAAPRFAGAMEEMVTSLWDFDQKISNTDLGGLLVKGAEEVATGVDAYGNAFTRFVNFGGNFNDAFAMAEQQLRASAAVMGDTLAESVASLKERAEQAAAATEIDLTPQIKALDTAKTTEEINRIRQEIIEVVRGSAMTDQEITMMEMQLNPEMTVDPGAAAAAGASVGEAMEPAKAAAEQSLTEAFSGIGENLGATVDAELQGAIAQMDGSVTTAAEGIGTSLGDALGGVEIPIDGLTTSIMSAFDRLGEEITAKATDLGTTAGAGLTNMFAGVTVDMAPVGSAISTGLTSAITTAMGEAATVASSTAADITTAAVGGLGDIAGEFEAKGTEAGASLAAAIGAQEGEVSGAAGTLKSAAIAAVANIDVSASGAAVGDTFAAGIRSRVDTVRRAAGELAAAARDNFPNSPAKIGPFSGAGWVDRSGIAVGMDFAKGMLSQKKAVESAAASVVGAAHKQFEPFAKDLQGSMEGFQRDAILQPVLESNAKKIHDHRKREAESAEKLSERIADINKSDSKEANKTKQIAKAKESAAERSAEAQKSLAESIEAPEYRDINRSFQSYWIDGTKQVLTKGLTNAIEEADLAGQIRDIAMVGVREGRRVFGSHPIFDQVQATVNADYFARLLQKIIEDSGIAEIPVNFVMSNLDQLKSDLGMGDGVISRALDAVVNTDPAESDARWARQNPVEIHYHVADMEEAIRLEKERERKAMTKYR